MKRLMVMMLVACLSVFSISAIGCGKKEGEKKADAKKADEKKADEKKADEKADEGKGSGM